MLNLTTWCWASRAFRCCCILLRCDSRTWCRIHFDENDKSATFSSATGLTRRRRSACSSPTWAGFQVPRTYEDRQSPAGFLAWSTTRRTLQVQALTKTFPPCNWGHQKKTVRGSRRLFIRWSRAWRTISLGFIMVQTIDNYAILVMSRIGSHQSARVARRNTSQFFRVWNVSHQTHQLHVSSLTINSMHKTCLGVGSQSKSQTHQPNTSDHRSLQTIARAA